MSPREIYTRSRHQIYIISRHQSNGWLSLTSAHISLLEMFCSCSCSELNNLFCSREFLSSTIGTCTLGTTRPYHLHNSVLEPLTNLVKAVSSLLYVTTAYSLLHSLSHHLILSFTKTTKVYSNGQRRYYPLDLCKQ